MNKARIIIWFLIIVLFSFVACQDDAEENDWAFCEDCTADSWVGEYEGIATYYSGSSNTSTKGLEMTIRFEETGTDYLTAYISVPNFYSASLSGKLVSTYSVSFASSNSSLNASLLTKDGNLKVTGSAKKFHYDGNDLIVDESITFESLKI